MAVDRPMKNVRVAAGDDAEAGAASGAVERMGHGRTNGIVRERKTIRPEETTAKLPAQQSMIYTRSSMWNRSPEMNPPQRNWPIAKSAKVAVGAADVAVGRKSEAPKMDRLRRQNPMQAMLTKTMTKWWTKIIVVRCRRTVTIRRIWMTTVCRTAQTKTVIAPSRPGKRPSA
jgi:hypothetical protein